VIREHGGATAHAGHARRGGDAAAAHLLLERIQDAINEQLLQPRVDVAAAQRADHLLNRLRGRGGVRVRVRVRLGFRVRVRVKGKVRV